MTDELRELEKTVKAMTAEPERRALVFAGPVAPVNAVDPTDDPRTYLRVGAILAAKVPEGNAWDRVVVRAFASYDQGTRMEIIVAPVDGFESPISVDAAVLDSEYVVADDGPDTKPWETNPTDLFLGDSTVNDPAGATRVLKEKK